MNLNLAQCLNTAESRPAVPGGDKVDSKAPGGLGLSFPSLLSQENKDLEASPIQLALLMSAQSPKQPSSSSSDVSGGEFLSSAEGKGADLKGNVAGEISLSGNHSGNFSGCPSAEMSLANALAATQARTATSVSSQQISPTPLAQQDSVPTELQLAKGSLLLEQGAAQNTPGLPLKLLGLQLPEATAEALLASQRAQSQDGKIVYQLDGHAPEEVGKWMPAHRHLVLRSPVAGMGTATRTQPIPNQELSDRPAPVVAAEVSQSMTTSMTTTGEVATEGLPSPVHQQDVQSSESLISDAAQTANTTDQQGMKTDQLSGSSASQGNLEIAAAAGLVTPEDLLASLKIPMETLAGETGKTAGSSQSNLPGTIRNQVMNQVASRLEISPGGEKLTIKLEPEHLGKVEVQLTGEKDHLTIVLKASGQEAELALQKGIKELTENILDRSQRWQTVEVRVEARETPEDRSQGRSQERRDSSRQQDQNAKHEHSGQDRHQRASDDAEQAWGG